MDDNDERIDFRLSKDFDIGFDNVRDEQEGEIFLQEKVGTDYDNSVELRSLPSDNKTESSTRKENECWFNPIRMIKSSKQVIHLYYIFSY